MKTKKEFINIQQAEEYKAKCEKLISALKIPFIISSVATLICAWILSGNAPEATGILYVLMEILGAIGMFGGLASLVFTVIAGGGKFVLSFLLKLLFIGFVLIPIPFNIVLGFIPLVFGIASIVFAPVIIIVLIWLRARKELNRAKDFIHYNTI